MLIEAKSELEHGEFINWVVCDLRFGTRAHREPDLCKAEMLMFLARNEVISNSCGTQSRDQMTVVMLDHGNRRSHLSRK